MLTNTRFIKGIVFPVICLFTLFCLLLSSCSQQITSELPLNEDITHPSSDENDFSDIVLTIDELSPHGATYSISNNGDHSVSYGYDYGIEIEKDGAWFSLEHDDILTLTEQLELRPGQSESHKCDWSSTYGVLESGQYRLIKSVYDSNRTSILINCEFTLN